MCKQCSVKRLECQNRSNRRLKLAESVQIAYAAAAFMGFLLMLEIIELPSGSNSISCTKHKVLFFTNRIQIFTLIVDHPHWIAVYDMHFALLAK